jgi:tRNA (mo5U34)-methyltransferase
MHEEIEAGRHQERAALRRRVDELSWFHRIDLGNGVVTPGAADSARNLAALHLPPLAGKTVIDIGASDGFYSFAAERAGASRVVAVEPYWGDAAHGLRAKAGFDLAHEVLDSRVEPLVSDLYDLTPERVGSFDVVLMLGVLYHLRDPLLALERVANLTNELLVLESLVDCVWTSRPIAAFYPADDVLPGDATNWWGPNPAALVGMLQTSGFREVECIGPRGLVGRIRHTAYNAANILHSRLVPSRARLKWSYLGTDRAVVHARR